MLLKAGAWDKIGIFLVHCLLLGKEKKPSLPVLTKLVSGVVLESPRLVMLGDFNIHIEAALSGVFQDLMTSITTTGYPKWYLPLPMSQATLQTWSSVQV